MEKWVTLPNGNKVKVKTPKKNKAEFPRNSGYNVRGWDKNGKLIVENMSKYHDRKDKENALKHRLEQKKRIN